MLKILSKGNMEDMLPDISPEVVFAPICAAMCYQIPDCDIIELVYSNSMLFPEIVD